VHGLRYKYKCCPKYWNPASFILTRMFHQWCLHKWTQCPWLATVTVCLCPGCTRGTSEEISNSTLTKVGEPTLSSTFMLWYAKNNKSLPVNRFKQTTHCIFSLWAPLIDKPCKTKTALESVNEFKLLLYYKTNVENEFVITFRQNAELPQSFLTCVYCMCLRFQSNYHG